MKTAEQDYRLILASVLDPLVAYAAKVVVNQDSRSLMAKELLEIQAMAIGGVLDAGSKDRAADIGMAFATVVYETLCGRKWVNNG